MTVSATQHTKNLRRLSCVVCGSTVDIELHHCHSGSMVDAGFHRGLSRKASAFLQIPLNHKYHTGQFNPEAIGMRTWERMFGTQMEHLERVSELVGYDVIELARRAIGPKWGDG